MTPSNEHEPGDYGEAFIPDLSIAPEKHFTYLDILQQREKALGPDGEAELAALRSNLDLANDFDRNAIEARISNLLKEGEAKLQKQRESKEGALSTSTQPNTTTPESATALAGEGQPPRDVVLSEGAMLDPEAKSADQKYFDNAYAARIGSDLDDPLFASTTIRPNTPNKSLLPKIRKPGSSAPKRRPYYGPRG